MYIEKQSDAEIEEIRRDVDNALRSQIGKEEEKQQRKLDCYIYGEDFEEDEENYLLDDDIWL
jgi:hypothetical protein